MSNQYALQVIFQALEHSLVIIFGCIILFIILVALCKLLTKWRDRAVRRVLDAEFEQRFEAQNLASIAEGEKRYGLELALHSVWDEVTDLTYTLHGTSKQIEDGLWEICQIFGIPKRILVLPEVYRPFHVELMAIARGLTHLGSQIGRGRAEREDVDFYQAWVEELWARFRLFELNNNNQQRRLQGRLSEIRELHADIGKAYCLATINPAYQKFPGMLHIVEVMIDDNSVPAEHMSAYVVALASQLATLVVSLELSEWDLKGEEKFLKALLASCGTHSK